VAQLEIARRGVEQQERSVASDAAAQARIVGSARRQVELAELNLNLAEETLAAEKARQAVGRAIQKDVLEVQQARARAEVSLVEARTGYRKALVSLEALQGSL
jgi:outer membrane protein TolC